jgi:hypothetical protein
MRRVPFQCFFPVFHFVMDLILVFAVVFDQHAALRRERRPWTIRSDDSIVMPVALLQESGAIEFDPKNIDYPPSPPLMLIGTSAVPTTLVLGWAIPRADLQRKVWRSTEWWWLGIYEVIGGLLWLLMGGIADRGQQAVYRRCFSLVLIRILALAVLGSGSEGLGQSSKFYPGLSRRFP